MSENDDRYPVTAEPAIEPASRRVFRRPTAAVVVPALIAGLVGGATSAGLIYAFTDHGTRPVPSASAVANAPAAASGPTAGGSATPGAAQPGADGGRPGQAATSAAAWLGVRLSPVDAKLAGRVRVPVSSGVMVASVDPSSPAAKAGLSGTTDTIEIDGTTYAVGGDVITGIDGTAVTSADQLKTAIAAKAPGDVVKLAVVADDGTRRTVDVTLGSRPAAAAPSQGQQQQVDPGQLLPNIAPLQPAPGQVTPVAPGDGATPQLTPS